MLIFRTREQVQHLAYEFKSSMNDFFSLVNQRPLIEDFRTFLSAQLLSVPVCRVSSPLKVRASSYFEQQ